MFDILSEILLSSGTFLRNQFFEIVGSPLLKAVFCHNVHARLIYNIKRRFCFDNTVNICISHVAALIFANT